MTLETSTKAAVAAVALAAGGVAFGAREQGGEQPQGVYSAEQLLDADVYAKGSGKEIGEIEDIIFDNDMNIHAFAVQTESSFGLAGKSYVVSPDQISVEARRGDEATEPEYRIILDATADELSQNPVYSDSWWNRAQQQAGRAWQQTKETASSAWTTIKEGTADLLDSAGDAADDAVDQTGEAADSASDAAGEAVQETGEAAEEAGDAANEAAESTEDAAQDVAN